MKSMTGYGRARYENEGREYAIEIKSVNNRYSDISIKVPRNISYLEDKIKKLILQSISRGKVDVFINFTNNSDKGKNITINTELAEEYIKQLKKLTQTANIIDNIGVMDVVRLPDVLNIMVDEEAEEIIERELILCLNQAIDNFVLMRKQEGEKIKQDLKARIEIISKKVKNISNISTGLVKEYIVKLEKRINEILKNNVVDEARLAQEVVIYSDKSSVEEELTRLNSHILQFLELIEKDTPCGKNIDFLLQEMNRETNTIGSKANNLEITNMVVEIKTELENIREQIQNIE